MLLLLVASCLALAFIDPARPCACWLGWARRHRRVPMPTRRAHRNTKARIGRATPHPTGNVREPYWRSKPEWACKKVIYFASHGWSCREIEARFNRQHGGYLTVGHSWVAEHIKTHAAEIAERRKAMRRYPPRFFAVGHTWAGPELPGQRAGLHLRHAGHHRPRLAPLAVPEALAMQMHALALLGHLFLTMARCGVPTVIRTDNESMFASMLWRTVLSGLGICHRRSRLGCPWDNGRIERLFGTLKSLLRSIRPHSVQALRQTLAEFTWFYNHVRVHQNLKGLTPMEAWNGNTLADVQQAHMQGNGRWVQALEGRLTGQHIRCW
ncbi:transposase InsO family protein [Variovorax boronicumulans]|uniref:integrase core domain-containing protein n=1 Tax=Variovorax boronicumulans TaxID=436515 RepID=UPI002788FBBD|nr:integrase core domain-containing protein [Variovorax boronicumulans]MDQ0086114.1 transposase InsO family protein [Variovorax boronicumulans]